MRASHTLRCAGVVALTLLPSCAWSNQDNRPVWNAFERTLVPSGDGLFLASLPLTVPLGLGAIVIDTVIAHPLRVVDDAYGDAASLWDPDDLEFEHAYYTEMAFLPLRTVATPVAFLGSFALRSIFDIRAPAKKMSKAEREAWREEQERKIEAGKRTAFIAWLRSPGSARGAVWVEQWHPSFDEPMRQALAGDAGTRVSLHNGMLRGGAIKIGNYDATQGLRDSDPVVRYSCVKEWPRQQPKPPAELVAALWNDPVESIRLLAKDRFRR